MNDWARPGRKKSPPTEGLPAIILLDDHHSLQQNTLHSPRTNQSKILAPLVSNPFAVYGIFASSNDNTNDRAGNVEVDPD